MRHRVHLPLIDRVALLPRLRTANVPSMKPWICSKQFLRLTEFDLLGKQNSLQCLEMSEFSVARLKTVQLNILRFNSHGWLTQQFPLKYSCTLASPTARTPYAFVNRVIDR